MIPVCFKDSIFSLAKVACPMRQKLRNSKKQEDIFSIFMTSIFLCICLEELMI
jgi:hypothetical protein